MSKHYFALYNIFSRRGMIAFVNKTLVFYWVAQGVGLDYEVCMEVSCLFCTNCTAQILLSEVPAAEAVEHVSGGS